METKNQHTMVSVICNTYNHEAYIRDALEGFVMQKTTFPFEVLVHDDASTDGTADIIREYERRYPDLIKPIYQEINQKSKGLSISRTFQYPRVKGKYIAFCEGDDYWTDSMKLQKQYDAMEQHPELDICAHASSRVDAATNSVVRIIAPYDENCIIPLKTLVEHGSGFVQTASFFYREEILQHMPKFRQMADYDYCQMIHGAMRGGMLYLADNMSVYRANVTNSWTSRLRQDTRKKIQYKKTSINIYKQIDIDTGKEFHGIMMKTLMRQRAKIALLRLGLIR